jgi:hypothetical protein
MKMFILGAVCFYVITSLIGFILDQLNILDYCDFGQFYVELIPTIVVTPFVYIKTIYDHWDYYYIIIKNGMFFKKYEEFRKLDTPTLRDIQNTKCGFAVRSFIDTILKERNQLTYDEVHKRV